MARFIDRSALDIDQPLSEVSDTTVGLQRHHAQSNHGVNDPLASSDGSSHRRTISLPLNIDDWSTDHVVAFLSQNSFGTEWQTAFRLARIEGSQFRKLTSYPELRKLAPANAPGPDVARLCNLSRKAISRAEASQSKSAVRNGFSTPSESAGFERRPLSMTFGAHRRASSTDSLSTHIISRPYDDLEPSAPMASPNKAKIDNGRGILKRLLLPVFSSREKDREENPPSSISTPNSTDSRRLSAGVLYDLFPPNLHSPTVSSESTSPISKLSSNTLPKPIKKILIQVTADDDQFLVTDITRCTSAIVLRQRICNRLGFTNWQDCHLYKTEIGGIEENVAEMNDTALVQACQIADGRGSLKIFVRQFAETAKKPVSNIDYFAFPARRPTPVSMAVKTDVPSSPQSSRPKEDQGFVVLSGAKGWHNNEQPVKKAVPEPSQPPPDIPTLIIDTSITRRRSDLRAHRQAPPVPTISDKDSSIDGASNLSVSPYTPSRPKIEKSSSDEILNSEQPPITLRSPSYVNNKTAARGLKITLDLPKAFGRFDYTHDYGLAEESYTLAKSGMKFKIPSYGPESGSSETVAGSASSYLDLPKNTVPGAGTFSPGSLIISPRNSVQKTPDLPNPFLGAPDLDSGDSDDEALWAVAPKEAAVPSAVGDFLGKVSRKSDTLKVVIGETTVIPRKSSGSEREFYPGDDKQGISSPMHSHLKPAPSQTSPLARKTSMKENEVNVWAVRPTAEAVYNHLEDFFPHHDLDKPVIPEVDPDIPPSPEDTRRARPRLAQHRAEQRKMRMKSIRVVAKEASEARSRFAFASKASVGLLRRSSTKVWGSKAIEMTPGQIFRAQMVTHDLERKRTFKWVKGELIGKGTYGSVFLAMNANTGEMLAVKQVELPRANKRFGGDDDKHQISIDALNSEIETMKDLDHFNIVQYLGYERTDKVISIFLEYVSGGSIGSCLRKHGPFDEPVIRSLIRQTLEGLSYLHTRGILHRDLKADNLLLDMDGTCKISDFGISKRSKDVYANDMNMSMQGTIYWMAPEVFHSKTKGYSAKVDIWALGCVVLEMFAGRRPWSNHEAFAAMYETGLGRAPPIPEDVRHRLSLTAIDFLNQCFCISPDDRPTADQLLHHDFSTWDPNYNWFDSLLAKCIRPKE